MVHEHVPSTGCAVCDAGVHAGEEELAAAAETLAREGIRRRAFLGGAAGAAVALGAQALLPRAAMADGRDHTPHPGRTLILEPSWVLTFENNDLQLRRDHSVVVQNGRIAAVVTAHPRARRTAWSCPASC